MRRFSIFSQILLLVILFLPLLDARVYLLNREEGKKFKNILKNDKSQKNASNDDNAPEITWEKIRNDESGSIASVHVSSSSDTFVIFTYNSHAEIKNWSRLYVTRDLGKSLNKITLSNDGKTAIIDDVFVRGNMIIAIDKKEYVLYSSKDGGINFSKFLTGYSSVQKIKFHKNLTNYIAAIENGGKLYVSGDSGNTWDLHDYGIFKFVWSPRSSYYYYLSSYSPTEGRHSLYRGQGSLSFQYELLKTNVIDIYATDDLVYVQVLTENEGLKLYISRDDSPFKVAEFPHYLKPTSYDVRHSTANDVFVMVNNASGNTYLYSGLIVDLRFTRLAEIEEYSFSHDGEFRCNDIKIIENIPGLLIGNVKSDHVSGGLHSSMVSFTHGVHWTHVNPPLTPQLPVCKWPNCFFSMELGCWNFYNEGPQTVKGAPHIILSHGIVQNNNETTSDALYISTDAGMSWSKTREGRHIFTILDQGGVIAAYPEHSNSIYYSYDEGRKWSEANIGVSDFYSQVIYHDRHGVATASVAFGYDPDDGSLVVARSDFKKALGGECKVSDYVDFTPGSTKNDQCFQGKKNSFKKRQHEKICLGIYDKLDLSDSVDCPCSEDDFGCYYGYYMVEGRCVADPDYIKNVSTTCDPGNFYFKESKRAKLLGDSCKSTTEVQITTGICGIEDESDFIIVRVGNTFRIITITKGKPSDLINIPIKSDKSAPIGSFSIDVSGECIYFTVTGEIRTICWGTRAEAELDESKNFLLDKDIHSVQIDNIARNVFFLDSKGINIITIGSRHRKLIVKSDNKINFFKVFPISGMLIFSEIIDKDTENLNFADMTGKVQNTFKIDGTVITASDSTTNSSYDVYTSKLRYTYTVGDKTIKNEPHKMTDLISVDVKNGKSCILTASKIIFDNHEIKHPKMDEIYYHSSTDFKKNPCSKTSCSHICVPEIPGTFSCMCPINMTLGEKNLCKCDDKHPNCTECGNLEFQCKNSKCVNIHAKCNGVKDCDDGSDEEGCAFTCNKDEFQCLDNSTCINIQLLCDGVKNCKDGSDEKDCKIVHPCKKGEFTCANGICIPEDRVCDDHNNCGDYSDEENCQNEKCKSFEFQCKYGGCTLLSYVCDGKFDCRDWSDEENCFTPDKNDTKPDNCKIECDNKCIPKSKVCDHITDCSDKRDEMNCGYSLKCPDKKDMICPQLDLCYPPSDICDGFNSCPDEADESSCSKDVLCLHPSNFHCATTDRCILSSELCNGVKDCDDGSDEEDSCLKTSRITRLSPVKVTFTSVTMSWKTFMKPENPTYHAYLIPWKHKNTPVMNVTVKEENYTFSGLAPCSSYIVYVAIEGSKYGVKYDFVTHNSEREAPLSLVYSSKTSKLSWKYNTYKCRPTVFYVNCDNNGALVFHNFTTAREADIYVNVTSNCQVAACESNVFNFTCSDYSVPIKVTIVSKTNKTIAIIFIVFGIKGVLIGATYVVFKYILRRRINLRIPSSLRNIFKPKAKQPPYASMESGRLLGGVDEDDDDNLLDSI